MDVSGHVSTIAAHSRKARALERFLKNRSRDRVATRTLSGQITQKKNDAYKADFVPQYANRDVSTLYPISFEITMTQGFSEKDPLALIKKKPTSSIK